MRKVVVFMVLSILCSLAGFTTGCAALEHKKHKATLIIDSDPKGARISEKDIGFLGQTPYKGAIQWSCPYVIFDKPSKCRKTTQLELLAELSGYQSQQKTVTLVMNGSRRIFFTLAPKEKQPSIETFTTKVYVESDPEGAFISVDGRHMGKTPTTIELTWTTGTRQTKTMVIQKTGYRDGKKEVTPEDDRVVVVLQPLRASDR